MRSGQTLFTYSQFDIVRPKRITDGQDNTQPKDDCKNPSEWPEGQQHVVVRDAALIARGAKTKEDNRGERSENE